MLLTSWLLSLHSLVRQKHFHHTKADWAVGQFQLKPVKTLASPLTSLLL